MARTIIIGDVHACLDELKEMLDKVAFDKSVDTLVFTGDLMDRGKQSYDTFQFVKSLKEELGDRCHYVLGNHEDFLLQSQHDPHTFGIWTMYNGGEDTCQDFEDHGERVYDYVDWIKENTELYYETEDYIVAHGGSNGDIHTSDRYFVIWDRDCVQYGIYGGKLLIVGHTPMQCPVYSGILNGESKGFRLEYAEKKQYSFANFPTGCIDIDTGCTFGYWLTAMVIEDGKFELHRVKHHKAAPDADDDGEEMFE